VGAATLGLVLGLWALTDSSPRTPAPTPDGPFLVGGIQVHERDHARWADALRQAGLNTVEVTVYARQGDWDGDNLWFDDEQPAVVDEIRTARSRGLTVVLVLRVALDHAFPRNKFLWHGMIMPRSDELIRSWFDRYGAFVRRWAEIAEREGVDVLAVGSELKALTATLPITRWGSAKNYYAHAWYQRMLRDRARRFAEQIEQRHLWVRGYDNYETLGDYLDSRYEHNMAWARQAYLRRGGDTLRRINERRRLINGQWIELIEATRRVYGGKLTYAANFDQYHNVGFWAALDLMGINSYFSLRPDLDAELDDAEKLALFRERWREILDDIESFTASQGIADMPYLFTELGYTFRRHSTVQPWAHGGFSVVGWGTARRRLVVWGDEPVDYAERALALEALHGVREERGGGLMGILYWKLSTDKGHEAIEPFVLHIGADSADPLQRVLARFVSPSDYPGSVRPASSSGS
jgi:hypothetical protein